MLLFLKRNCGGKGIATEVLKVFIGGEVFNKYDIEKIGAFTYSNNYGSIGLLKKGWIF